MYSWFVYVVTGCRNGTHTYIEIGMVSALFIVIFI
jgi:hypothetical protein